MSKRVHIFAGAGFAATLVGALASNAVALEYCVTCEGPPALYRCMIEGTDDGPGNDPSVSLYCISQMAAKGGHASCAVSRGAPFPCPGLMSIVQKPSNLPTLAAPPPGSPAPPTAPPETATGETLPPVGAETAKPAHEEPAKVPRTVEELAGQTFKSSKEGMQKAGDAIGGTAKKAGEQIGSAGSAIGNAASKTWTCITSLFSSCGTKAAEAEHPAGPAGTDPAHKDPTN